MRSMPCVLFVEENSDVRRRQSRRRIDCCARLLARNIATRSRTSRRRSCFAAWSTSGAKKDIADSRPRSGDGADGAINASYWIAEKSRFLRSFSRHARERSLPTVADRGLTHAVDEGLLRFRGFPFADHAELVVRRRIGVERTRGEESSRRMCLLRGLWFLLLPSIYHPQRSEGSAAAPR